MDAPHFAHALAGESEPDPSAAKRDLLGRVSTKRIEQGVAVRLPHMLGCSRRIRDGTGAATAESMPRPGEGLPVHVCEPNRIAAGE